MSMVAVGISSLALTGISVGLSASGALNPNQPDLASSTRELSNAKAGILPLLRGLEAAAAKGESFSFTLPKGMKPAEWMTVNAAEFQPGGRLAGMKGIVSQALRGANPGQSVTVDFTGYGTADTQGKLAEQNAQNALALSRKFDSRFIESALAQEKLADPEGVAARARMHELIGEQAARPANHPVADLLERQVGDQLKAGSGLDAFDRDTLDRAVASATASRGGAGAGADFAQPLTTGFAGEERAAAGRRKALALAGSGATPEDLDYRRNQQVMANLSAAVNGVTPQSQFGSLSGAQQGPTPQVNGAPLPVMGGNTAAQAGGNALAGYNAALAQPNQWMAGLGALLNAAGTAGKAGAFG